MTPRALLTGTLAVGILHACPARADLLEDVERVEAVWREQADVTRLEPRLLERGTLDLVGVPEALVDPTTAGCTVVLVMGPPDSAFVVRFLGEGGRGSDPPEDSVAGAAQVVRCATRKASLARLVIEMRSPRLVVETVVARAAAPLPAYGRILPLRDPGPPEPMPSPGPKPAPLALELRLRAREAQRRAEGAATVERRSAASRANGSGDALVPLEPGCHVIDVLVPDPIGGRVFEVDAELGWPLDASAVASDRAESSDASVGMCVGARRAARLSFSGAPGRSRVAALHSTWSLPTGVPRWWSGDAAARVAMALRRVHPPGPSEPPIYEAMGVAGVTLVTVPLEPGACYVAAVGGIGEGQQSFRIAALAGTWAQHQSLDGDRSAAVAFCADSRESGRVEIEAQTAVEAWVMGVWRASRVTLGEIAE